MDSLIKGQTEPAVKRSKASTKYCLAICFALTTLCFSATAQSAPVQSKIFVKNDTTHELAVESIVPSGDSLSKKAWKRGVTKIAPGKTESVLVLNRSGKVNWMDPTPRFIEPGKTATFAIEVTVADAQASSPILLKQKLHGTGKSSKMWYSIQAPDQSFEWQLDDTEVQGTWNPSETIKLKFTYGSFTDKGATHVQYVFSPADS